MAKLLIKGHTKFVNHVCPEIPYYKIKIELVSNNGTDKESGEVVFNYEHGRWNWRWADRELIDHFDMRWQNSIEKEIADYCHKYLSNRHEIPDLTKKPRPSDF